MCGRTCCTLSPDLIPFACANVTKNNTVPKWKDGTCKYFPSTNIPPTGNTPILYRDQQDTDDEYVIQPMFWSIIPSWFKGNNPAKEQKLTTNNARLEGLLHSKIFKPLIERNQRCVIVCDGFYEWKSIKLDNKKAEVKQPYLIYSAQLQVEGETVQKKVEDLSKCTQKDFKENKVWTGPQLTFMAGLYSIWYREDDESHLEPIYSYSIITRESNKEFNWLHHRVPCILPNQEAVTAWLGSDLKGLNALKVLKPLQKGQIAWHPVSKDVGSSKNYGSDLNRPVELGKNGLALEEKTKPPSASANLMKNWLIKKSENKKDEEPPEKKSKN